MKTKFFKSIAIAFVCLSLAIPRAAKADFFGGDIPLLLQVVSNTLSQLAQLRQILGTGNDTLGLLRDVNEGIREAMGIMRTMNRTMQPGVLNQYQNPDELLRAINQIYGAIPKTPEARVQQLTDQSVAEAITLHNQAFQYADQIDPEAERIKDYSRGVSPTGAGRLTAQSLGVLIHVSNQILRTNAAMLKVLSEHLALQNRKDKVNSQQFQMQYEGLASALSNAPSFRQSSDLNY
jgi:hypothetical protein